VQRASDDRARSGALRRRFAVGAGDGRIRVAAALPEPAGRIPPTGLRERRAARPSAGRPNLALASKNAIEHRPGIVFPAHSTEAKLRVDPGCAAVVFLDAKAQRAMAF
jgi:hypothetical protein